MSFVVFFDVIEHIKNIINGIKHIKNATNDMKYINR